MAAFPESATYHAHPGHETKWTDLSAAAIAERKRNSGRALAVLATIDRAQLNAVDQVSYDLFKDNAGKSEHDIVVEIDRYIVWPGQALAYKLGELKIKELRARAVRELGAKFDVRLFHDEVLRHGALPLTVLDERIEDWVSAQKRR